MPLKAMLHKSFRFIASLCAFSIGVSQPIPAHALRPHVDQSGLEERLGTARLREALNEQTWNQLKHFAGRMEELGISWLTPVKIAGVWADVDRTQTHPEREENGLSPSMTQNYAWIMRQGGTVGAISAAPYRVMDILDRDFYFPASLDERVVGRIRKAVTSPEDMERLRILARSGGIDVRFSSTGEESIALSPILFSREEITKVSKELAIAMFHAITRKDGTDLSRELDLLSRAPDVLPVARILRHVERAKNLILLPGITPLEIDGGMIFLSFQDGALDSEAILAEAKPRIEEALRGRSLQFIQGPMYVAVSLFEKTEMLRKVLPETDKTPGVLIVVGDGTKDDLPMLRMAAGSSRLVLPYFMGPPETVAKTDAVVVPHSRRFVEATEWFLAQAVSAAQAGKPYADLPFIAGEATPRQVADALGVSLGGLSQKLLELDYSRVEAILRQNASGLEEFQRPGQGKPASQNRKTMEDALGFVQSETGIPAMHRIAAQFLNGEQGLTLRAAAERAYPVAQKDDPKQDRARAASLFAAAWVGAQQGLSAQEMTFLQSLAFGTETPGGVLRAFSGHHRGGRPDLTRERVEQIIRELVDLTDDAGLTPAAKDHRPIAQVLAELRPDPDRPAPRGWDPDIRLSEIRSSNGAGVFMDSAQLWIPASPVEVLKNYGDGLDSLPPWRGNTMPVPAAQSQVEEASFSGDGMFWKGYLQVPALPLPPKLRTAQDRQPFSAFLKPFASLGDTGSDSFLRDELLSSLHPTVQVWGHYRVTDVLGEEKEMMVRMRPVNVWLIPQGEGQEPKLGIRFETLLERNQYVNSRFTGELLLDGQRYALNQEEQRAQIVVIPASPLAPNGGFVPTEIKRFIAGGGVVTVAHASSSGEPILRQPVSGKELLPTLIREAVQRASEQQKPARFFANLDLTAQDESQRVNPGFMADFLSSDYVNTPIQWRGVTKEQVWIGLRGRSSASLVFEAKQQHLPALISQVEESLAALAEGEVGFKKHMIKVDSGADGTVQVFIAPRNPSTDGKGWGVLADQDYYAVDVLDAQAGLATPDEMSRYGYRALSRYPWSDRVLQGPYVGRGRPLFEGAVDALTVYAGVLVSPAEDEFSDHFLPDRVRRAVASAGVSAAHPRLREELERLKALSPYSLVRIVEREFVPVLRGISGSQTDSAALLSALTLLGNSGRRRRYETAFKSLSLSRQRGFTHHVWKRIRSGAASGQVALGPVIGESSPPGTETPRGLMALDLSPTLDLFVEKAPGDSNAGIRAGLKPGGMVAHIAQALNRFSPGASVTYVASLAGETGDQVQENLSAQGMKVYAVAAPEVETRVGIYVPRLETQDEIRFVPRGWEPPHSDGDPLAYVRNMVEEAEVRWNETRPGTVLLGGRLPEDPDLQEQAARILHEGIGRLQAQGAAVVLSAHGSWNPATLRELLSLGTAGLLIPVEGLAAFFGDDPLLLKEDPQRMADRADELRVHRRIGRWVAVSAGPAGLVVSARENNIYATPPAKSWLSYTTGAADASLGAFLATQLDGTQSSAQGAAAAAAAFAIYRARSYEERGVPATVEEVRAGPIARIRPLPRTLRIREEQDHWDRLRALQERLETFQPDPDAAVLKKQWGNIGPDSDDLLRSPFLQAQERFDLIRRLFRVQVPFSSRVIHRSLHALLRQALSDSDRAVRTFAAQQWVGRERAALNPLVGAAQPVSGVLYQVEIEQELLEGVDPLEWNQLQAAVRQAAVRRGAELKITRFQPNARAVAGVRRVALLTPSTARLAPLENSDPGFRVLPMERLAGGRTRLLGRAILLALAVANQPERGSTPEEAGLIALRRYFQFLEISVSIEALKDYLTLDPSRDEWVAALAQLTLNLNTASLEPLLTQISFEEFLEKLETDLSV